MVNFKTACSKSSNRIKIELVKSDRLILAEEIACATGRFVRAGSPGGATLTNGEAARGTSAASSPFLSRLRRLSKLLTPCEQNRQPRRLEQKKTE